MLRYLGHLYLDHFSIELAHATTMAKTILLVIDGDRALSDSNPLANGLVNLWQSVVDVIILGP